MKTDKERFKNFLTGMTGVFTVAAELSAKRYIVTLTSRNAPGIDIIASSLDLKKTFNIQVKANASDGTQSFWLLNKDAQNLISPNFFYVFVNFKKDQKPDFYVVESSIVAQNVEVSHSENSDWYSFQRNEKYKVTTINLG
ncbi:MAG: hypothetical protein MUO73_00255 [Thermoplasmata archaeon]|nr:hypothetical protein [Thermoplasmata archaeon]